MRAAMHRPLLTALALLVSTSALAGTAEAAEWIRASTPPSGDAPAVVAERFVRGVGRTALQVEAIDLVRREQALALGDGAVVRFEQRHRGLPVESRGAAVQVLGDGRVRVAMVDVARHLDVDTTPAIDAATALERVRAAVLFPIGRMVRSELVVVGEGGGRLAWRIDALDPRGGVRLLVDAHDGRLVSQRALASDARGLVYAVSSVVTPEPSEVVLETLDTTADPIRLEGWDGLLHVGNYVSGGQQSGYVVEQTLGPSDGENFLYPPPEDAQDATDAFAQVNLFHHLTTHRTFFRDVLGVGVDAASWEVTAVANLQEGGQPLDNAFFSPMGLDGNGALSAPNMIGIGQGTIDFAYDSDVFKHEFGHYVSHNAVGYNLGQTGTTEYGLSPHSGSVDEGIADYFACSENDDPILGEASLDVLSAARNLEDDSKSCPDDMVGEVHADGEIVASLSWTIRQALGREVADRLVWGAVSLMPAGGTLGDFATGLVETANALVEEGTLAAADVADVEAMIEARGLHECDDVIPLIGEEPRHATVFGLDLLAQLAGASCGQLQSFGLEIQSIFHFSGQAPGGDSATFHLDVASLGGGSDVKYRLVVRKDQHVGFDSGGGFGLPAPSTYDHEASSEGPTLDLVIDASSDPPFDPSATYYAVIVSQSCPTIGADISLRSGGGEGPTTTTGAGGDDAGPSTTATSAVTTGAGAGGGDGGGSDGGDSLEGDDDGCGCEVAGAGRPGGALAALGALAAAALLRMRRRVARG